MYVLYVSYGVFEYLCIFVHAFTTSLNTDNQQEWVY